MSLAATTSADGINLSPSRYLQRLCDISGDRKHYHKTISSHYYYNYYTNKAHNVTNWIIEGVDIRYVGMKPRSIGKSIDDLRKKVSVRSQHCWGKSHVTLFHAVGINSNNSDL